MLPGPVQCRISGLPRRPRVPFQRPSRLVWTIVLATLEPRLSANERARYLPVEPTVPPTKSNIRSETPAQRDFGKMFERPAHKHFARESKLGLAQILLLPFPRG